MGTTHLTLELTLLGARHEQGHLKKTPIKIEVCWQPVVDNCLASFGVRTFYSLVADGSCTKASSGKTPSQPFTWSMTNW